MNFVTKMEEKINVFVVIGIVVYAIVAAYCFDLFYGKLRKKVGFWKFLLLIVCLLFTLVFLFYVIGKK